MKIRHFPLFSISSDSSSSNWFDKNADFVKEEVEEKPRIMKGKRKDQGGRNMGTGNSPKSFRDDFRGTRVFVQGIPDGIRWQELKDHFKVAGDVVFASVSIDSVTGESKGCGVVQFESTDMAKNAINILRDYPIEGHTLYVRPDYQEDKVVSTVNVSSTWQCSDERSAKKLSSASRDKIESLLKDRNRAREERDYDTSDRIRDNLKFNHDIHLDDRVKLWWISDDRSVPRSVSGAIREKSSDLWRCADEDNAKLLSSEDREMVESLIKERDQARRRKDFDESDGIRNDLKFKNNIHLDDRLKLWWNAVDNEVPKSVSDIKGEGRWGKASPWRMIPTTPSNDACVSADVVQGLLNQRDIARKEKDFKTADLLLEQARTSPDGDLNLRIHDDSRTWRIWTEAPPRVQTKRVTSISAYDQCIEIVLQCEPEKLEEMKMILKKFPGREYNILKKLKQNYKTS